MLLRKLAIGLLSLSLFGAVGCATKPQTLPPGASNSVDLEVYESLMVAQSVLNDVKANASKFPPAAKPYINTAIVSYNAANHAFQAYKAGNLSDPVQLQMLVDKAVADALKILTTFSGVK